MTESRESGGQRAERVVRAGVALAVVTMMAACAGQVPVGSTAGDIPPSSDARAVASTTPPGQGRTGATSAGSEAVTGTGAGAAGAAGTTGRGGAGAQTGGAAGAAASARADDVAGAEGATSAAGTGGAAAGAEGATSAAGTGGAAAGAGAQGASRSDTGAAGAGGTGVGGAGAAGGPDAGVGVAGAGAGAAGTAGGADAAGTAGAAGVAAGGTTDSGDAEAAATTALAGDAYDPVKEAIARSERERTDELRAREAEAARLQAEREAAAERERRGRIETAANSVKIDEDERLQTLDGALPAVLSIDEKGHFAFDRYDLAPDVRGQLDVIAERLKDAPYDKLYIVGYTDRIGTEEYNRKLSEKRAWSVAGYLMDRGVPPYKLKVEGRGEAGSITTVNDCQGLRREALIECLQRDRRVEVVATVKEYNIKVQ